MMISQSPGRKQVRVSQISSRAPMVSLVALTVLASGPRDMWSEAYAPGLEVGLNFLYDHRLMGFQEELAPSKTRVKSVKNWIHTALYGYPTGLDAPPVMSPEALISNRKYKVSRYFFVIWEGRRKLMSSSEYCYSRDLQVRGRPPQ